MLVWFIITECSVLQRLREAELTVKPSKCQIGMRYCVYLGYRVGDGEIQPEMKKIEAVSEFPQPISKKDVRAFLGLTGYYRKFIPNYSTLALPLTDLTRKNAPNTVKWTSACEMAFQELKGRLTCLPVLKSPDLRKNSSCRLMLPFGAWNRGSTQPTSVEW